MLRYSFLLLSSLVLAAFVLFIGYEAYAVFAARSATAELFTPYEHPANSGLLTIEKLPPRRMDALIKVQDPDFWTHRGIDSGRPLTTTTVTQSIVKQLYFDEFHSGFAKIKQTLIARFAVDPLTTKRAQLTAFINLVGLGETDGRKIHGFEAGARAWFSKPFDELSEAQFLSLLAMLNKPNALTPGSPENIERVGRIQKYLSGDCERRSFSDVTLEGCRT